MQDSKDNGRRIKLIPVDITVLFDLIFWHVGRSGMFSCGFRLSGADFLSFNHLLFAPLNIFTL